MMHWKNVLVEYKEMGNLGLTENIGVWLAKRGVLLIGYDIELGAFQPHRDREYCETDRFLEMMVPLHQELGAPCTLFVCGLTLDRYWEAFEPVAGDATFEFANHTYSHLLLKTVVTQDRTGEFDSYEPHASMDELVDDIENAQATIESLTGERPVGFCGPWGYAMGLSDRWDLIRVLCDAGIRYCRTYARRMDERDLYDLSILPFWYSMQGFPDVLEIPFGEPCDVHVRPGRYPTVEAYSQRLDEVLAKVARNNYVYSYATHDWSSPVGDPDLNHIRRLINGARELGIEIMTHREYYRRSRALQMN